MYKFRYKGAREITPGARHFMFAEGDTYTLIINNVYIADADEYVCRAVNKGGVKSTKAELIIMSKYRNYFIFIYIFKYTSLLYIIHENICLLYMKYICHFQIYIFEDL